MNNQKSQTVGSLKSMFSEAEKSGTISVPTRDLLCVNLDDSILAGSQGADIDDITATEVTLVTLVIDDSGSMDSRAQDARAGQNEMLKAFAESKQKDSFLLGQWALNRTSPYHSYVPVDQATKLDGRNYKPDGSTPLYDRWCQALAANVAYAAQLRATGTPVRSIAAVITDGENNDSRTFDEKDCRRIAKDLIASEQFILAFIGVGNEAFFRQIAKDMGIPDGAVLIAGLPTGKAGATASEMRKVFRLLSQSVIRASQTSVDPATAQNAFFAP